MFKEEFAKEEFEILNNNVPFIAPDLAKIYDIYSYRILSYLGVKSIPVEKKERLLVDEIGANDEEKEYIRSARLEQRKIACEQMKKVFNIDVSVEYKEEPIDDRLMQGAWALGGKGANTPERNERD